MLEIEIRVDSKGNESAKEKLRGIVKRMEKALEGRRRWAKKSWPGSKVDEEIKLSTTQEVRGHQRTV